jgi:hypothetical protein
MPLAPEGAHVWKTSDATVDKKFRRLSESSPPKLLARVSVSGAIGTPLKVTITDGMKIAVGQTDEFLLPAEVSGLSADTTRKAVGTLGNSKWVIVNVENLDESAFCPISHDKEARRRAMVEWEQIHGMAMEATEPKELLTGVPAKCVYEGVVRIDCFEAFPKSDPQSYCHCCVKSWSGCKQLRSRRFCCEWFYCYCFLRSSRNARLP